MIPMRASLAVFVCLSTVIPVRADPAQGTGAPPPLPSAGPPPLPQPGPVEWFAGIGGQQAGPFTLDQMRAKIAAREIKADTLVWNRSLPAWTPARDTPELQALFAGGPPPMPEGEAVRQMTDQLKEYMAGEWMTQGPAQGLPGGFQTLVVRYNRDGSFSGYQKIEYGGAVTNIALAGRWELGAINDRKFTFTANTQGSLVPDTAIWIVVDDNTLRNERDGSLARRTAR